MQETIKQNVQVQTKCNNREAVKPFDWGGYFWHDTLAEITVRTDYPWARLTLNTRNVICDNKIMSLKERQAYLDSLYEITKDFREAIVSQINIYHNKQEETEQIAAMFSYLYFFDLKRYYDWLMNAMKPLEKVSEVEAKYLRKRAEVTAKEIISWYTNELVDNLLENHLQTIEEEYKVAWERAELQYLRSVVNCNAWEYINRR